MKILKSLFVMSIILGSTLHVQAYEGVIASEEAVKLLKADFLLDKVTVGKTRLKEIRRQYGDAPDIDISEKRIKYNYGDLRLVFEKKRILKAWEYDTFKDPVYSNDVEDLRYDLESGELVGKNISYRKILRKYDVPTEIEETDGDGEMSVYYYGNIKLIFENVFTLQSLRGQQLGN